MKKEITVEVTPRVIKELLRRNKTTNEPLVFALEREKIFDGIDKAIRKESHIPIRIKHVDKKEKKK